MKDFRSKSQRERDLFPRSGGRSQVVAFTSRRCSVDPACSREVTLGTYTKVGGGKDPYNTVKQCFSLSDVCNSSISLTTYLLLIFCKEMGEGHISPLVGKTKNGP